MMPRMPDTYPPEHNIRVGTLCNKAEKSPAYLRHIAKLGFESFQLNFHKRMPEGLDLRRLITESRDAIADADSDAVISSVGIFGNPIQDEVQRAQLEDAIDAAGELGVPIVASFAGALDGEPVEAAIKPWADTWRELVKRADAAGVTLAFENCPMGSSWEAARFNIGFCPRAWTMMFNEIDSPRLGLEWEPAHQMRQLIDPIPQLRQWVHKVVHVHGKDATVEWDTIRRDGIIARHDATYDRHPGFGDTNWTDVISILRQAGFAGSIDLEGWHDSIYRKRLELTGQVAAMEHLKRCRGGRYIAEPVLD